MKQRTIQREQEGEKEEAMNGMQNREEVSRQAMSWVLAGLLAGALAIGLYGCGGEPTNDGTWRSEISQPTSSTETVSATTTTTLPPFEHAILVCGFPVNDNCLTKNGTQPICMACHDMEGGAEPGLLKPDYQNACQECAL